MIKIVDFIVDEESGQGMAEYALLMALIIIVTVGGVAMFGEKVFDLYDDTVAAITP